MRQRLGIENGLDLAVFLCLVLLVAISPLGREATHPITLGLTRTLLLTIIVTALIKTTRSAQRICPYFLGCAGALIAVMAASVLMRTGSHFEGEYVLYENALFLTAFILLAHVSRSKPAAWKNAILSVVVLVDVAYLVAAIALRQKPLLGPFVNPNYFASFLLAGLAVCTTAVFFGESSRVRMSAAAAGAFLYYGIGQTSSRGATLAAMALVSLALFRAARRRRLPMLPIAGALAALCAVTAVANHALIHKFLDRNQQDPYNYQRTQIWKGTLKMIADHPVLGVGLGRYRYAAKQFTPAVEGAIARYRKWPNIAHSEYLQFTAELGAPTAALLFGMALYLLVLAWKRSVVVPAECRIFQESALCAAVGLGAHALVDNNWTVPVLAAGMAIISQADLLPYAPVEAAESTAPHSDAGERPSVLRAAFALCVLAVFVQSTLVPAIGFHFNEAGRRAYAAEDLHQAETMHRYALAVMPDHPVLLDNLGLDYFDDYMKSHRGADLDRAESIFQQAIAANPNYEIPGGHLETVLIQRLTGDPEKDRPIHARIIETDRRVLQTNPFNPFIRKNLAEALYNSGNRDEAREELLKAVELEPNYVEGYLRLAEWCRQGGLPQQGDEYTKKAIAVVVQYQKENTLDPFDALLLGRPPSTISRP
jgi:O-antigen ligase/Tfp pilus assembly protein PilF